MRFSNSTPSLAGAPRSVLSPLARGLLGPGCTHQRWAGIPRKGPPRAGPHLQLHACFRSDPAMVLNLLSHYALSGVWGIVVGIPPTRWERSHCSGSLFSNLTPRGTVAPGTVFCPEHLLSVLVTVFSPSCLPLCKNDGTFVHLICQPGSLVLPWTLPAPPHTLESKSC